MVLDEPSVNLDDNNKRGLAIAMAQIIADRSKQNNFQLVLITHDDTFISMMKDELSSQTGFSMPENYFHVRREQASDHKFYSKIDRCDWVRKEERKEEREKDTGNCVVLFAALRKLSFESKIFLPFFLLLLQDDVM